MDADPGDGDAGLVGLADGFEGWGGCADLVMAVHAGVGRGDGGAGRAVYEGVAVTAVDI